MAAIGAGKLQYRVGVIHGNPWLRLLRREVEELMTTTHTHNDRDHRQTLDTTTSPTAAPSLDGSSRLPEP